MNIMKGVWALIWLVLLFLIGWPVAGICVGFYVFLLPFSACVNKLSDITDFLYRGVRLPYEMAVRMKDGKSGW